MNIEIWIAYLSTVLLLMSTPGPSQLLMLSNSIENGFRRSIFTACGDLTANFLQMLVASYGLASVIRGSAEFFIWIKWAGVGYLIYLGLRQIFARRTIDVQGQRKERSLASLYWQGFITSASNPKAVIFFAALFPQFINPSEPLLSQFAILSATYITIDGTLLCFYGLFAQWVSVRLRSRYGQYFNRVTGSLLIGAAILLGLKEIEIQD